MILYIKFAVLNPLKSLTFKTMSNDMLSFDQINTESACDVFNL